MDVLAGITDNYKNKRYETEEITVKIQDSKNPAEFTNKIRKFKVKDYKDMTDYNLKRDKYFAEKGKIWTYLSKSVDSKFYNELPKDLYMQYQKDLNVHGLYQLIKSHAQRNNDPKGVRLKQEFNNFYQYNRDTNTVMPYLEFLSKFESMCLKLHGKEREPSDAEKSERLVFALHRPLFDSYITNILATNEFPSFSELKERLRNL